MVSYATNDIISHIVARLERDRRVNLHAAPITVSVEGDRVILEGQVDNIAAKRAAVDTVTRVLLRLGQWQIVDWLHVKPTRQREDAELRQAAILALGREPVFNDYSLLSKDTSHFSVHRDKSYSNRIIIVTAAHGGITLSGLVESLTHWRLAEVLMWWMEGCEFVDNQLQIVSPVQDSDNEITNAVRCVLEKDPMLHTGQLQVGTAGSVVFLNGSVASEAEKKFAIRDAWYVPGVADVVDRIQAPA